MGYFYAELAPAAILFNNPGMTANEFQDRIFYHDLHEGMLFQKEPAYILPGILRLPTTKSFEEFDQEKSDSHGLSLSPPEAYLMEKPFKVHIHIRNELLSSKIHKSIERSEINDGQVTYLRDDDYLYSKQYLINQVLKKTKIKLSSGDILYRKDDKESNEVFEYEFKCQEINKIIKEESFKSVSDLFEQWPQFKPENRFDFSIPNGVFYTRDILKSFRWKQINGRYYFDERSFDLMPAGGQSIRGIGVGYTDLIITAEAIKNNDINAMRYTTRGGGQESLQSLKEYLPEISRRRVEIAIWDAQLQFTPKKMV